MMAEEKTNYKKRQLTIQEAQYIGNLFITGGAADKSGAIMYNCPFHDDSNPSMQLYDSKTGPRFKCHGCGWGGKSGGDAYDMVGQLRGIGFSDAVNLILGNLGDAPPLPASPSIKKGKQPTISAETRGQIYTELVDYSALCVSGAEYLEGRGLEIEQCHKAGLRCFDEGDYFKVQNHMKKTFPASDLIAAGFYAKDKQTKEPYFSLIGFRGRILIPYLWSGKIVGLQGRSISDDQLKFGKYRTAWIPTLYIPQGMSKNDNSLWICEGAFDALAHIQHGGRAIAFSGASVCDDKVHRAAGYFTRMNPPRIVLAIEEDTAGDGLRTRLKQNLIDCGYPSGRVGEWDIPSGIKDLCEFYSLPTPAEVEGRRKMEEAAAYLQTDPEAMSRVDEILTVFPDAIVSEIIQKAS
jgi:DNA primase